MKGDPTNSCTDSTATDALTTSRSQQNVASEGESRLLELKTFEERLAVKSSKLEPAGRDRDNEEKKISSLEQEKLEKGWVDTPRKPLPRKDCMFLPFLVVG